jgi:hypothetical protein
MSGPRDGDPTQQPPGQQPVPPPTPAPPPPTAPAGSPPPSAAPSSPSTGGPSTGGLSSTGGSPSGPHPGGPHPGGPHPVGPPPGGSRPPAAPARRPGRVATLASLAAVVLAVLALGVAIAAYGRAGDKPAPVAASPPVTGPPGAPTTATTVPVTPGSGSDDAATDESIPTPVQEPQSKYTDHVVRIQPTQSCSAVRTVDVDEPRVDAPTDNAEFTYGICAGSVAQFDFADELEIAEVTSPTATARDCLKQLQDAPINEPLTPHAGQTLCVVTSRAEAEREGISRKVARIAVQSIGGDGTVTASLTAWDLPRF